MSKRLVAPLMAFVTLAVPASASAQPEIGDGRARLPARPRPRDPDTSGRQGADPRRRPIVCASAFAAARLIVLGDLGEPMLRIDPTGTWVERGVGDRRRLLGSPQRGPAGGASAGATFTWHDHRLAPPPYDGGRSGPVARFVDPGHPERRPRDDRRRIRAVSAAVAVAVARGGCVVVASGGRCDAVRPRPAPAARARTRDRRRARGADGVRHVRRGRRTERAGAWAQIVLGVALAAVGRGRAHPARRGAPRRARGPRRRRGRGGEPRLARRVPPRRDRLASSRPRPAGASARSPSRPGSRRR